jgi:glucose/arabinose dehydrogenase
MRGYAARVTRGRLAAVAVLVGALAAAGVVVPTSTGEPHQLRLRLQPIASGLVEPLALAAPRNEPNRLYVAEQAGRIRVIENGRLRRAAFLDIRSLVTSGGEQGFLGFAFHPNYQRNRRLYVQYTDRNGETRVVEYRSNGVRALPGTRRQLFFARDPYANHNAGQLAFGPEGQLYFSMGDGGSGGDPGNRAQNPRSLFGKLIRIDVDRPGRRTIVALGLRNPWRFSFDRATGDLYLGDVGQSDWEEIDYLPRARLRDTTNFGWDVYEGRASFEQKEPSGGRLVFPIVVLQNPPHGSVIGGYVYRGGALPSLRGRYFYSDFYADQIYSLRVRDGAATGVRTEPFHISGLASFGEDAGGELYAVSLTGGRVYKLVGS